MPKAKNFINKNSKKIMIKKYLFSFFLFFVSLFFAIIFCEVILRIKHTVIPNYDIEMWNYAKELKVGVENKNIGHVHVKNKSGIFQKVEIKTNAYGQRDVNYDNKYLEKFDKSFLVIGNSIVLGWGVEREKTFTYLLNIEAKNNNKNYIFVNGGIGNYNSVRYVNNYLENWKDLKFTHLIINYFVTDAEILENKKSNFFIEYTHTGVILWKLYKSFDSNLNVENIANYYEKIYDDDYEGFNIMKSELKKLNNYCNANKIKCTIVNMPDIHRLNPYKLSFINQKIKKLSEENNIEFIDLLPIFENMDEKKVWNKYQDPHPNDFAHKIIAKKIFESLK
jgi:hypothetical protein